MTVPLGQIRQATELAYVSVTFHGGCTDVVELRERSGVVCRYTPLLAAEPQAP